MRTSRRVLRTVQALKVGNPLEESTQIGLLVDANGLAKVRERIEDALANGARIVTGGDAREGSIRRMCSPE